MNIKWNSMRGGVKGQKGFLFEELHAANGRMNGQNIYTINNNGKADFKTVKTDGTVEYGQAKIGYGNNKIDFSQYDDMKIVVDKGNEKLANQTKNAGLEVEYSPINMKQVETYAKARQLETKITGNATAPCVDRVVTSHCTGTQTAKISAKCGSGISLGSNLYEVMNGNKSVEDAIVDVGVDTVVATGVGYVGGAVSATAAVAAAPLLPVIAGFAALGFIGSLLSDL